MVMFALTEVLAPVKATVTVTEGILVNFVVNAWYAIMFQKVKCYLIAMGL
jgi:hypothetical protein